MGVAEALFDRSMALRAGVDLVEGIGECEVRHSCILVPLAVGSTCGRGYLLLRKSIRLLRHRLPT